VLGSSISGDQKQSGSDFTSSNLCST
jgi:hypothetical protein